jgi:Zn-dependent peptidase ImmA (M78 family)
MTETVPIKPEILRWAIERSRLDTSVLEKAFPKIDQWLSGEKQPTNKQLEQFADKTMTPLGYFFLDQPPEEKLTIPDFRTMDDMPVTRPSPNLLETIQSMKRRQAWMRDYLIEEGQEPLDFVGEGKQTTNVITLANRIRATLGLNPDWSESQAEWETAFRTLRQSAERIGILVAVSGYVGLNTHRTLDPQEFRGFVLCDEYAPLIFLNGVDARSAQMFTFAHELVHVWLGQGGLFNLIGTMPSPDATERFCNEVAAEFLIPAHKLKSLWEEVKRTTEPFRKIASMFKVSPIVAARRAFDLELIDDARFFAFYRQDQENWARKKKEAKQKENRSGPDFYVVQDTRLGRKFAYAVVTAAREGRLLYRDAYQLTDLKGETFDKYADLLTKRMKDERR